MSALLRLSALLSVCLLFACQKEELYVPGDFVGVWQEEEDPTIIQFAGSNHRFEFTADGAFRLQRQTWTDVILVGEPCEGGQTDFIAGQFSVDGDQLSIEGVYMDQSFTSLLPNCEGESGYSETYDFAFQGDDLLLNPQEPAYLGIRLVRQ
ncbi:MAG: hypothetical protein KDC32_24950 [Saprospiraceae bacterium]|nr:hypothetical protein [Saprospiraceae bacterium]